MARPKKKGVDYFPHDCVTGKTIYILEQKFGNDGYAFWFKLLEFLGTKEGHYLDCHEIEDMEFLQAKTKLDEEMIYRILDLLSKLNAIDRELWEKRVVWSQRFVDGIADVYVNRRVEKPSKPNFYIVSTAHNPATLNNDDESTSKSTQSKVKESKVKKTNTGENGVETIPEEKEEEPPDRRLNIDEVIQQLQAKHEDFDLSKKDFFMYLVDEMAKIFVAENPDYFFNKQIDYSALLQIAYNIALMKKWQRAEVVNGRMEETITSWKTIVKFIKKDEWLSTRSLSDLSSINEWQRLVLKMKKPQNGKEPVTSVGKTFTPD